MVRVIPMEVRVTRVGSAEPLPSFGEVIADLRSGLRAVEPLVGGADLRRWTAVVDRMERHGEPGTAMGRREQLAQGVRLLREMRAAAQRR